MMHLLAHLILGYQPDIAGAVYAAGQSVVSWVSQVAEAIQSAPCPADWLC